MARFVNACGPRGDMEEGNEVLSTTDELIAVMDFDAGALGNGAGFIGIMATVEAVSTSAVDGFPCELGFSLNSIGQSEGDADESVDVDLRHADLDPSQDASATMIDFIGVAAEDTVNLELRGVVKAAPECDALISAEGSLMAQYFPFDRSGRGGAE
jgi:hypothetical protein